MLVSLGAFNVLRERELQVTSSQGFICQSQACSHAQRTAHFGSSICMLGLIEVWWPHVGLGTGSSFAGQCSISEAKDAALSTCVLSLCLNSSSVEDVAEKAVAMGHKLWLEEHPFATNFDVRQYITARRRRQPRQRSWRPRSGASSKAGKGRRRVWRWELVVGSFVLLTFLVACWEF